MSNNLSVKVALCTNSRAAAKQAEKWENTPGKEITHTQQAPAETNLSALETELNGQIVPIH